MANKLKILIIANARWKGGLSGGDNIYLNFAKRWPADVDVWEMMFIDCKPFFLCYIWRIYLGCMKALLCRKRYDIVYSASDFWMDSFPAVIIKLKSMVIWPKLANAGFEKWRIRKIIYNTKWVAGFYLEAPKNNTPYRLSQFIIKPLIRKYADMVFITNSQQKHLFKNKKTVEVHGGVDFNYVNDPPRDMVVPAFDAVFCGRIHPTKGIDDLIDIWKKVIKQKPDARLAIIGDGDMGLKYLTDRIMNEIGVHSGIVLFGYMDHERFNIYKSSKVVLYPTRSHFSMAPVEAMACYCPMITYSSDVMDRFWKERGLKGCALADNNECFAYAILDYINTDRHIVKGREAYLWAKTWNWETRAQEIYWEMIDGLQIKGKE